MGDKKYLTYGLERFSKITSTYRQHAVARLVVAYILYRLGRDNESEKVLAQTRALLKNPNVRSAY